MDKSAFKPINRTHLLSVTASATTPILLANYTALSLYNAGSVDVFVALANTSAAATADCVLPIVGTPQVVICVPKGMYVEIAANTSQYIAAIGTAAGPTSLWITEGR